MTRHKARGSNVGQVRRPVMIQWLKVWTGVSHLSMHCRAGCGDLERHTRKQGDFRKEAWGMESWGDFALSSDFQLTHLLETGYQVMGKCCFFLHSILASPPAGMGPHVAGVPSFFLCNIWVRVRGSREWQRRKQSVIWKDIEKALDDRLLI